MSYEYFTEIASSYREAEDLVTQKYGERATILQRRQKQVGGFLGMFRKDAVEVSGYVSLEPVRRASTAAAMQRASGTRRVPAPVSGQGAAAMAGMAGNYGVSSPASRASGGTVSPQIAASGGDLESAKEQILRAAGVADSTTMTRILAEIRSLREDVNRSSEDKSDSPEGEMTSIRQIRDLLEENEFSTRYIEHIMKKCRELSMADLEDFSLVEQKVLEWVSESIDIHDDLPRARPRIVVLVGPTGVGKTTSIAKLAAQYHLGKIDGKRHSVRIITVDNYRIGAKKQIETYGEIMNIPVESAESPEELKKWIDLYHDVDMIFVDTIGRSPNEFETLGRMNSLLQVCGNSAEVHLAFSASTRGSDIRRIMQQFEPFNYQSVVVTKTDETSSLGTVISGLWEKNKEVSFITNGQSVPHDLVSADKSQFLRRLTGFRVDQDRLEDQYATAQTE
jgi:flagellar biosynthesis protein FlhF